MGSKERFYGDIQSLSNGVTGSCHLCIVKFPDCSYSRFIVDCGLFQGQNEEQDYNKDFPFKEESIEFALITHNHVDHVGRLPLMTKNGFTGKIYTTNDTAKLIPLALYDSCKVLKDVSKRNGMSPLYDDSNVQQVLSKVVGIPYNESFSAHAKADELISFLQQFSHINMLIVNHGDPSTKETFAKRLLKEVKAKEIGIASRDYFFRVSPYHLVKTLPTKFQ